MSPEESVKENIDELIYQAIETIRGKKYKIRNKFSICNYLNIKTDKGKGFIEYRIRSLLETWELKNKPNNWAKSYFKIYSTDFEILNDSDFSNKSNENIGNELTGTKPNKDLIKVLKSVILDDLCHILKFSQKKN